MKQKQLNLKKLIDQIATGDAAGGSGAAAAVSGPGSVSVSVSEHNHHHQQQQHHFMMRDHVLYNGNAEFYNHFPTTDDYPEGYQRGYSSNYHSSAAAALMVVGGGNGGGTTTSSSSQDTSSFVNNCFGGDSAHHSSHHLSSHHSHILQQHHHQNHPHQLNYNNGSVPVLMQQPQQIIPSNLCQYNGGPSTGNSGLKSGLNDDDGHGATSHLKTINGDNDENEQMDEKIRDHDDDDNDNSNGGQLFVIKKENLN